MRDLLTIDPGIATTSTPGKVVAYMPVNGVYPWNVNAAYSFGFPKPRSISDLPADFWDTNFRRIIKEKTGARKVAPIAAGEEMQLVAYGVGQLEGSIELTHGVALGLHSVHMLYTRAYPYCWVDVFLRGRGQGVYQSPRWILDDDSFNVAAENAGQRILRGRPRSFNINLHTAVQAK